ncbi:major facilitator superfamily MFS_1 [Mesorhizobium opportunistum WSM2075]|uniref:Major facilitator superfamily MFS_1 n=1 Tax=Mesorhizobium opportunistum (strain LMG 24607 / HAMBI 3007 / WSM2075) TaxID=536019 RepID=F7YDI5_MESOW|nr:major facilitator superfamily MFS_1 [Mesorhizobium opportunistum WSM2075]
MTAIPETEASSETATNARRVALIVAIAFFMQLLDSTIISTSLPQMGASFGVPAVAMSIGITIYMLTMAVFVPLSGWLADRFGARNIFLVAIALFTLASLACGFSQNLTEFVAARAVQGLGSALMTPVGRILVLRNASKSELLNATALITWPALFAPVVGPVLGGFITTYLSWHWNFFINIPLGAIGLALVARFIPGDREADPKPLDWPGFFLTSAGLALLLYGLERIAHPEDGVLPTVLLIVAGIIVSWLAARHLRRAPHPLLDLSSFKVLTFAISTLAAGTIFRVAINATPFLLPLLFQVGFGLSPVDAGMMILAYFLGNLGMDDADLAAFRLPLGDGRQRPDRLGLDHGLRGDFAPDTTGIGGGADAGRRPVALDAVHGAQHAGLRRYRSGTAQFGGDAVVDAAAGGDAVRRRGGGRDPQSVADREGPAGARPHRFPNRLPGDRRHRAGGRAAISSAAARRRRRGFRPHAGELKIEFFRLARR